MQKSYKVYLHRRADTGEIFYAGHGQHARPWATTRGRSLAWQQMYTTVGRTVEVVARYNDKELAAAHEVLLIAHCRELGLPMVNRRSGGDDHNESIPHTSETRALMRTNAYVRTTDIRQAASDRLKGKKTGRITKGNKGMKCYTNGVRNTYTTGTPPEGFYPGRTLKKKIGDANRRPSGRRTKGNSGMIWCNNGQEAKMFKEIPDGWQRGRVINVG